MSSQEGGAEEEDVVVGSCDICLTQELNHRKLSYQIAFIIFVSRCVLYINFDSYMGFASYIRHKYQQQQVDMHKKAPAAAFGDSRGGVDSGSLLHGGCIEAHCRDETRRSFFFSHCPLPPKHPYQYVVYVVYFILDRSL